MRPSILIVCIIVLSFGTSKVFSAESPHIAESQEKATNSLGRKATPKEVAVLKEALGAYWRGWREGDLNEVKRRSANPPKDDDVFEKIKGLGMVSAPTDFEILHASIIDDKAILEVHGTGLLGENHGKVEMVRDGEVWKFLKEDIPLPSRVKLKHPPPQPGLTMWDGDRIQGDLNVSGDVEIIRGEHQKGTLRILFIRQEDPTQNVFKDFDEKRIENNHLGYRIKGIAPGRYKVFAIFLLNPFPEAGAILSEKKETVVQEGVEVQKIDFVCREKVKEIPAINE